VPGTGVFLNNCMQNFDPRPDRANAIAPGKMPIFAVPSLVSARDGRPGLGVCGSGGYRILSGVLHTFCHAVDCGLGLQAAVDAPRVHCQGDETYVDDRIDQTVQARLAAMGHRIVPQAVEPGGFAFGRVCAVGIDRGTGLRHGGAGPAWATAVAGY
jgi:gamma-glutamyltranspeptidase/glutathione hydrolase